METAPVQLLTGNPTSLFDILQQLTSPGSSAASAQALNDLQHNVQQLKQQLISTAEQSDKTALQQLTEPGGSHHEPIQQRQQQMKLSDKHCQLAHEWELHKAAALQQRLEVQQLSTGNLACLSTAQHACHAEHNTIEGWLYSQYQQLVAESQDITRDQSRSQAESAEPSPGLKLCAAENKGCLGIHELQLLCGQWHFQAQNEKAKYEALRDMYILLQQAYRALEEKLERTAAATACQEGFDACHAVKNPVYSVPTADQGVQTDRQTVQAQLEVTQQQWQGAQQVVEKLVEASSVRMQLQVAEAEHLTPEVVLRDASLTTDGSNAWNFVPVIKQLQQHMQLHLTTPEPTLQMSPLPQPRALTPRPKSPFELQPSPLVSTEVAVSLLMADREQDLTPAGPRALLETLLGDADSMLISTERDTMPAEQQMSPTAPSALLHLPLLGRNSLSMLKADIVNGQEAEKVEAGSAEPQATPVLAIPADLAHIPGIELGLIDLDSNSNLLEPWTGFDKPTLPEVHTNSAAAAVLPTQYERNVLAWLDSHPTVDIREVATAAREAAEEAEVMAWLNGSLRGSVNGGCDDDEQTDTTVLQAGRQSPDCLASDDELVPVAADLMQRLSQANSTIEAQQSDLASLQAQNALLKQQVEQQQALLDELTQSEEGGVVQGEAQAEGSGGVGWWGGEADEEVTGPASRKLVTC